jgi:hypothetical protein
VNFSTEAARNVGELLERFFEAPHLWKLATIVSHGRVPRVHHPRTGTASVDLRCVRVLMTTTSRRVAAAAASPGSRTSPAHARGPWPDDQLRCRTRCVPVQTSPLNSSNVKPA